MAVNFSDKSPVPPLFSLRSHRLRIGLLIMLALYVGCANRMSLSTAVVCMVNNTLLSSATSNDSDSGRCSREQSMARDELAVEGHLLWTPPEQSLVVSASFYGSFLTVLFSGGCADYFGPGVVLVAAICTSTILTFAVPLIANISYVLFVASRVVIGMGESFLIPAINCTAARWYPAREKTTMAAFYTCGLQLAAGFASLLASQMCYSTLLGGWPSIFYVCGSCSALFLVLWTAFGSADPHKCKWASEAEKKYIDETINIPKRKISMAESPWRDIVRSRAIYPILTCSFAFGFSTSTMQSFLPTYLKEELGLSVDLIGVYTMAPFFAQMISKCICGPTIDFVAAKKIVSLTTANKFAQSVGSFGSSIALVSFAFIPNCEHPEWALPLLIIYGAVYAGGLCGFYTSLLTIAPKYTGTLSSLSMVFTMTSSICSSVLVTTLTSMQTPYKWHIVFCTASIVQAIGGVHYLFCGSTRVQPWASGRTQIPM